MADRVRPLDHLAERRLRTHMLALCERDAPKQDERLQETVRVEPAQGGDRLVEQPARLVEVTAVDRDVGQLQESRVGSV
jgi:hypothetical protein